MKAQTQHGGVFFYILLAVGMIAALSYTVSRGSRTSESALTNEQARIVATEIIEYGNTVSTAVQKLKLRGCRDEEISFESNAISGNYSNSNSPSDSSCHVFNIEGANINVLTPKEEWIVPKPTSNHKAHQTAYISSRHCVDGVGEAGCLEPELTFMFSYLKENICEQINQQLSITEELNDTNLFTLQNSNRATGSFSLGSQEEIDNDPDITGKTEFCVRTNGVTVNHTPNPGFTYIKVLIAR